jgi:membrane associated rhomboid family serine protease
VTPVVRILIGVTVAGFALQNYLGDAALVNFALWPLGEYNAGGGIVLGFKPWQLFTTALLHGGVMHLALNMFALYMFGRDVEAEIGSQKFAWLYGASVLAGSLAQLAVVTATVADGLVPTVGASGGVFGVLLAFGVLFPKRRVMLLIPPIPMPAWLLVLGYGVLELANGVLGSQQGVAHFAHLGGMAGAAVVLLTHRRSRPRNQA